MESLQREVVGTWDPDRRMVWRCRAHPHSRTHQYKLTLADRQARLAWAGGNGCPRCSFYGEECVAAWLRTHGHAYVREGIQPTWDTTAWRHDFELTALRVVVEVDGEQHFRKVNRRWAGPEAQHNRDRAKTLRALAHGWHVVRIRQWDVVHSVWEDAFKTVLDDLAQPQPPSVVVVATDIDAYVWLWK